MKTSVLFLTISDRKGASGRYRVCQYEPLLENAGFDVRIIPPAPKGRGLARVISRLREERHLLRTAGKTDIVFIQKRLFSVRFVSRLAATGKPLVFDFDDAIFRSARGDRSALTRSRVMLRLTSVLRAASLVIAGNSFLAAFAGKYAACVEVLPTAVDTRRYSPGQNTNRDECVLGWIGSRATQGYLKMIEGVLVELAREIPQLRLVVVSDVDSRIPGMKVESRRWSEETETKDVESFDIGLMPLPDNDWTRGKCALKALQYMAAGVPAVCSDVGAVRDVIEDGINGYLCADPGDWKKAIRSLAEDARLRAEIGGRGRARVENFFSVEKTGGKLIQLLQNLPTRQE